MAQPPDCEVRYSLQSHLNWPMGLLRGQEIWQRWSSDPPLAKFSNPKPCTSGHSRAIPCPPYVEQGQDMPPSPCGIRLRLRHAPFSPQCQAMPLFPLQGWVVVWSCLFPPVGPNNISFPSQGWIEAGPYGVHHTGQYWIMTTGRIWLMDGQGTAHLTHQGKRLSTTALDNTDYRQLFKKA